MTKKNEITVNASADFATASSVTLEVAQSKLRTSLQALDNANQKAVSAIQVSSIALVDVVHAGAGEAGLLVVPAKSELNEVLKVQIEAIAVNDDGTKNEAMSRSLGSSSATICEQAWCILAGHFRVAYRPKAENTYFAGQDKDGWTPNPNIHTQGVFRASNVPFAKFKDNGNIRTNDPDDIVPVTRKDTANSFLHYALQKKIANDQTAFDVEERSKKVETISTAKEAKTATLGLISWFKNQAFVDGKVCADLWDNEELDTLVRSSLFDTLLDLKDEVVKAKTVADAMQAEESLKAKEAQESAKLKASVQKEADEIAKIKTEITKIEDKSAKKSKAKVA